MKLYYFKKDHGNFGDDLNDWLWKELLPEVFDDDDTKVFFGIGTIINDRIYERASNADKIIIFGSGVGYGRTPLANLPTVDDRWKVYCLRGPLSAKVLGLSSELAVADGAILIRRLFSSHNQKKQKFAYMPHVGQALEHGDVWNSICQRLGYGYIDPRWKREKVLDSLCQTEVLITEAMHGAIVADALRIPWIPVKTSPSIFEFKWWDWCKSVELEYTPYTLSELPKGKGILSSTKGFLFKEKIIQEIKRIEKEAFPCLSKDRKIEELTVRLEEKVKAFKEDVMCKSFDQ